MIYCCTLLLVLRCITMKWNHHISAAIWRVCHGVSIKCLYTFKMYTQISFRCFFILYVNFFFHTDDGNESSSCTLESTFGERIAFHQVENINETNNNRFSVGERYGMNNELRRFMSLGFCCCWIWSMNLNKANILKHVR